MQGAGFRGSMTHPIPALNLGKLSASRGACPVCGRDVARTHAFNGARLLESYGCHRCGPTSYVVAVGA